MNSRRAFCAKLGTFATFFATGSLGKSKRHIARFWHKKGNAVRCDLCPHACRLADGDTGKCRNRRNSGGILYALGYGRPCAVHIDPVEKKPFYHVLPGARTYSIGVAGCNLRCKNCQNYTISQKSPLETATTELYPDSAVAESKKNECPIIAFTYTEPLVWMEYMMDVAAAAQEAGMRTALISAGYINPTPLNECLKVIDFARFDLKSFDDRTYRMLNAGTLQPVLDAIIAARRSGTWVEIINLVIPGWNDSDTQLRDLCRWVKKYAGKEIPLHFSRFFPMYRLRQGVPTPVPTLHRARDIALAEGLEYVYIGNVAGEGTTTTCPRCGAVVIDRKGYIVTVNNCRQGKCAVCGTPVAGVWE